MSAEPIYFFNRYSQQIEQEKVLGEAFLHWTYNSFCGKLALHALAKRSLFSRWFGWRMNRPGSAAKIPAFIRDYDIRMQDFVEPQGGFANFNEFFYRKLADGARPLNADDNSVVFPADARHMAFADIAAAEGIFIKNQRWDLAALLGDADLAREYANGSLLLSRLCPVDYHRFHFPVAGKASAAKLIDGPLASVSPLALRGQVDWLWRNKRYICSIESEQFGKVLFIDVGATCVGSVHQSYQAGSQVSKGQEKGYFAFGGSTVICIFPQGSIKFCNDLLEHSARQCELFAHMGDKCASKA